VIASNPFINAGLSLLRLFSSGWFEFWNCKVNDNSIQFYSSKNNEQATITSPIKEDHNNSNSEIGTVYDIYCPPRCSVNSYLLSQQSCHFKRRYRFGSVTAIIFPCTLMHFIGFLIHLLFVLHLLSFHPILINLHFY